jgi:hypothetical protein
MTPLRRKPVQNSMATMIMITAVASSMLHEHLRPTAKAAPRVVAG